VEAEIHKKFLKETKEIIDKKIEQIKNQGVQEIQQT
jgi:hypothetical protein